MSLIFHPHIGASVMLQSGTLGGNTSGASTFFGSNVVLAGGSNVTLQASSDTVYIHGASGGGGGSGAGTDWAITGGSITVNTSGGTISLPAYLTTAAPPGAYLTTAAQSDHSHGGLSLVNLTGTSSSNGLTLSAAAPGGGAAIMVSAGTTSGNVQTLRFQDSNGVSFGLNGSTVTASHDGLTTTPRLDEIRNPTADALFAMNTRQVQFQWGTNWTTWTTAPSRVGLVEIDVGGNYTGTDHVDVLHIHQSVSNPVLHMIHIEAGGTNATGIHLEISGPVAVELNRPLSYDGGTVPMILGTSQSNVVSNLNAFYLEGARSSQFQSTGAYLTTAAQVSHSHGNPTLALTNLTGTTASASNGLTLSLSGNAAQTIQPAVGLNSAQTNVTWTVNSSGISINASGYAGVGTSGTQATFTLNSAGLAFNGGAYLTTAAGVSHSHGNPTLALTNLTGTTASASNGFTLSLSAAAPGAGGGLGTNTAGTNITWTANTSGLSINAAGYAGTGTSATNASITMNSNGLAISVAAPGGGAAPKAYWAMPGWAAHGASNALLTNITGISRRVLFMPFDNIGNLTFNELHWPMSRATSGSNAFSVFFGIYSFSNSSRLDTVYSTSGVYSNTDTASVSGLRGFELTFASTSITPGQYVMGLMFDPVGGSTASMNYSLMGAATGNTMLQTIVVNGSNTFHTEPQHQWLPFYGRFSVTSASLPSSVPIASVLAAGNATNNPLPMYWVLGTHNP